MKKIMFNDRFGLTQAVLNGRKTQTRRLALNVEDTQVFNLYPEDESIRKYVKDRYSRYSIGETLAIALPYKQLKFYGVSLSEKTLLWTRHEIEPDVSIRNSPGWNNKMFVKADLMPHQIRITNIRLERLQDISDEDCLAEGIRRWEDEEEYSTSSSVRKSIGDLKAAGYEAYAIPGYWDCYTSPKKAYAALIDKISGKGTWEKNPWVFVYDFELVK